MFDPTRRSFLACTPHFLSAAAASRFAPLASPALVQSASAQSKPSVRSVVINPGDDLSAIVSAVNASARPTQLLLNDGIYPIDRTLIIETPGIEVVAASRRREKVLIRGDSMSGAARIGNIFRVAAPGFKLDSVTLQRCGNHAVQIAGESGAHDVRLINCVFQDSFEQLVKVSAGRQSSDQSPCRNGLIEHCLFEYTAGIGPQFYIGGLDGHHCSGWTVRGNTFRNIASPAREVAEHAIHFWGTRDITVENNLIIDCDRGIGFGLGRNRSVNGGVIRNNFIFHAANAHPFADAGVVLESSASIDVLNNTIFQEHAYPRAIEFRFEGTRDGLIANNLTNRAIASRDGGRATVLNNFSHALNSMFVDASIGNLRLKTPISGVVDSGLTLATVSTDIDGQARPRGAGHDIGAHEF